MCLELAEHQATIQIRKKHLEIARQERETERARVEQGLSPQRKLLSHKRNVLDLELDLASLVRRMDTLKKEFNINWPGLNQIPANLLKKMTETDYRGDTAPQHEYDRTRSGQTWLSSMELDKTRIAVMNHRKKDQLDFNLSYNRNGTAQDQSDSWSELRKGDANEWRVGLSYRHTFGKDNDRLNYLSSKIRSNRNYQQYADAKLNWTKSRLLLMEEYENAIDNMQRRYQLLEIQQMEKAILDEELSEDLVTLEEVFNADKNLLNSKINIINQRKQQRLIDIRLKAHDEILLELIP
jgi:outer membrane protein TolC